MNDAAKKAKTSDKWWQRSVNNKNEALFFTYSQAYSPFCFTNTLEMLYAV